MARLPVVGVMGSGDRPWAERAEPLGRWLAARGVDLLTGGGRGVMTAVSRAFHETAGRAGRVIGVLPGDPDTGLAPDGYPNPWIEIAIRTHLPLSGAEGTGPFSRNPINVLTSDVVVALPGADGTRSEVLLAAGYGRPHGAWIAHPDELRGLPPGTRRLGSFEETCAFVDTELRRLHAGR